MSCVRVRTRGSRVERHVDISSSMAAGVIAIVIADSLYVTETARPAGLAAEGIAALDASSHEGSAHSRNRRRRHLRVPGALVGPSFTLEAKSPRR